MSARGVILILFLLGGALKASQQPSNLKIVAESEFYARNFWETAIGKAFWETNDGKLVLRIMNNYQTKHEPK